MHSLYAEALDTFATLLAEAKASPDVEPTAMTIASATPDGRVSARTVLLKTVDARGFTFYTHLDGRKGRELQANPQAALLLLWKGLREGGVQVRVEGDVEIVDDAEADAYFASRPRLSQIGAWASDQSETLASRDLFEQRIAQYESEFSDRDVPRPPDWSGFRVVPRAIEFWYGAKFRLHERWVYQRDAAGEWIKRMLYP